VPIYDDIVDRRGRPARDELPLLAPPPQRDDVAGAVRGGDLRVARAAGGAGWDAGADATGEWIVSARGAHTSRRRENDTPPVTKRRREAFSSVVLTATVRPRGRSASGTSRR
jgi:hypothetical protein